MAGGMATSDWLEKRLEPYIASSWQDGNAASYAITEAFLEVSGHASLKENRLVHFVENSCIQELHERNGTKVQSFKLTKYGPCVPHTTVQEHKRYKYSRTGRSS